MPINISSSQALVIHMEFMNHYHTKLISFVYIKYKIIKNNDIPSVLSVIAEQ
jgi:hypothetical protein